MGRVRSTARRVMVVGARPHCWPWSFLVVGLAILLAAVSIFVTLPLRDSDKAEAARDLAAWIVDGRSMPGFGEAYPDAQWMRKQKRFFVVCEFIPPEVSLSDDPRVQRITAQEYDAVFKKHAFEDRNYMFIELRSESGSELVLKLSNIFGTMAGHGYRFEFRRTLWGLRANRKFLWVS